MGPLVLVQTVAIEKISVVVKFGKAASDFGFLRVWGIRDHFVVHHRLFECGVAHCVTFQENIGGSRKVQIEAGSIEELQEGSRVGAFGE